MKLISLPCAQHFNIPQYVRQCEQMVMVVKIHLILV